MLGKIKNRRRPSYNSGVIDPAGKIDMINGVAQHRIDDPNLKAAPLVLALGFALLVKLLMTPLAISCAS